MTLTREWEKVEVMKRKTGNLRTTMRMDTGTTDNGGISVCRKYQKEFADS
jgi:hypothetical protein